MASFSKYVEDHPIVPYIREADYPIRIPYQFGERRLLDYLLVYVIEGQFVVHVNEQHYTVLPGECCLIQPNVTHFFEGRTQTTTPFIHFDIFHNAQRKDSFPTKQGQVDLTAFQHLMQPVLNEFEDCKVPIVWKPTNPEYFLDTMIQVISQWMKGDLWNRLQSSYLMTGLILQILEPYGTPHSRRESRGRDLLQWIPSYLSLHIADKISVREMAQRAHCSPSRFATWFCEQFNMSPHQYVIQLRINHARELLKNTQLPLTQIASYCGFADVQHFSKQFKQHTSMAPAAYRLHAKSFLIF